METIIIDTREQTPWSFPPYVETVVAKIDAGDYALAGDDRFAIERKTKDDFLGTISNGWGRFVRELNRMDEANFIAKTIIVECDFREFCFSEQNGEIILPDHRHYMLQPQFIYKRIAELTVRGVGVLFAGDAEKAAELAFRVLYERSKQIKGQTNDDN